MPHASSHLHPLQVDNCDSNSRLVVDEDDNVKSGLKGLSSIVDNIRFYLQKHKVHKKRTSMNTASRTMSYFVQGVHPT